jgi:hypothetical protein
MWCVNGNEQQSEMREKEAIVTCCVPAFTQGKGGNPPKTSIRYMFCNSESNWIFSEQWEVANTVHRSPWIDAFRNLSEKYSLTSIISSLIRYYKVWHKFTWQSKRENFVDYIKHICCYLLLICVVYSINFEYVCPELRSENIKIKIHTMVSCICCFARNMKLGITPRGHRIS